MRGADGELVDSVELLTSELVTNALVHAETAPRVAVQLTPATVRIEVYDDDPVVPQPMPFDLERPGGRGLFIVEAMSARWGAEPTDAGKLMWFELDRSEAHPGMSNTSMPRPSAAVRARDE